VFSKDPRKILAESRLELPDRGIANCPGPIGIIVADERDSRRHALDMPLRFAVLKSFCEVMLVRSELGTPQQEVIGCVSRERRDHDEKQR
jgi:hypothetical protein